jgi:hypothetical protein
LPLRRQRSNLREIQVYPRRLDVMHDQLIRRDYAVKPGELRLVGVARVARRPEDALHLW